MPPRRRPLPPPPAAKPSSASELDVDPAEEPGPNTATPTIQPRPGIVTNLPPGPRAVYLAIFAAGSNGVMMPEVCREAGMVSSTARRHVNVLKKAQLVKEISDVRNRSKKILVASDFEPASEIGGGAWYHDGRLDVDAVGDARRRCMAQVKKRGSATAKMVHEGIRSDEPGAGYDEAKVSEILSAMVLDKDLDESARGGATWYQVAERQQGGVMEAIPCGVCPRVDECSPEGVVSLNTCVYYKTWLQLDF
ncbi:hypothetical protein PR202_gb27842 [Eleusine coracana subsp. coracana]|uniref:DNA-directed RNA polymerase III subunit RPC6 n=1 Tax=Eleusine coracana subsp. coracana TaxID=191504 RepID=A0AAV5FUX0_ELECO|nr:hypothetical protein PR202_gb27842 [Eleusine coracana subsp. coracana]